MLSACTFNVDFSHVETFWADWKGLVETQSFSKTILLLIKTQDERFLIEKVETEQTKLKTWNKESEKICF